MSSQIRTWIGNAAPKTQVWQYTPPVTLAAPTWTLTINGKSLTYKSTGTSADAINGMLTLWRACQYPEFREITASKVATSTAVPQGAGTNEKQSIVISGVPTGGTFVLAWNGSANATAAIPYNASASAVQNALQEVAAIGPGNMIVTGSGTAADPFIVEFVGTLAATANQPLIVVKTNSLTGGTSPSVAIASTQAGVVANTAATTGLFLLTGKPGVPFTVTSEIEGQQTPEISIVMSTQGVDQVNEVQSVWLAGTPLGGTFTLTFGGNTTAGIAFNAVASAVQSALEALVSIGSGNVAVSGSGTSASPWQVTFQGALTGPQSLMTGDASGITGANAVLVTEVTHGGGGVSEIQRVGYSRSYTSSGTISSIVGNWTISFNGQTTTALAWNVDAATVQAALEGLSTIGPGNVAVSQITTPSNPVGTSSGTWATLFQLSFQGALASQNLPQATVGPSQPPNTFYMLDSLSNNFVPVNNYYTTQDGAPGTTDEVQLVSLTNTPSGGTFTLTFGANTTSGIAWSASAATVQSDLEGLASIGAGNVSVSGPTGGPWYVTFQGTLGGAAQSLITGSGINLTGDTLTISELVAGNVGTTEVQTVTLSFTSAGTFTLSFNGISTSALAYNISAANLQTALQGLSTIGSGNITASGGDGGPWTLTFAGSLVKKSLPYFSGDASLLIGTTETVVALPAILCTADGPNFWDNANNWLDSTPPAFVLAAPTLASVTAASGGSLSAGTYYYKVTATNSNGETVGSNEISGTTSGGNLTLALAWSQVARATGFKVYRGGSAGAENVLVATITSGNQTVFNDAGAATTSASPPGVSSAVGDDVVLESSTISVLYNLPQDWPTVNSLKMPASYTGNAGNPRWNGNTTAGYWEYRPTALKIQAPMIEIGAGPGRGSAFINLDTGTGATAITVFNLAPNGNASGISLFWLGNNAANTLELIRGSVGVAFYEGDTAQLSNVRQSYAKNVVSDSTLIIGEGCATIPTFNKDGGSTLLFCNVTTLIGVAGIVEQQKGAVTTLKLGRLSPTSGGCTYVSNSTDALGDVTISIDGVFDRTQNSEALQIGSLTMYSGATFLDPHGACVTTGQSYLLWTLSECGTEDVTLDVGRNVTIRSTAL